MIEKYKIMTHVKNVKKKWINISKIKIKKYKKLKTNV